MSARRYLSVIVFAVCGGALAAHSASAADITLNVSDVLGTSSFDTGLNWSNGQPPSPGNNYLLGENRLRTPPDANSYTFGGDSLVITPNSTTAGNGGLMYKGTGNTGVITINNLNLAGGIIHHQNGNGDLFQLAGNINVTAPSTFWAKQGTIQVLAPLSGDADLSVIATDDPAQTTQRFVNLAADNSAYTGNIDVTGKLGLTSTGTLRFNIGASGVNNAITGTGIGTFDGTFDFNLAGADTTLGNSWNIASVATRNYGENFNVNGFTKLAPGVWINGNLTFTESTGVLAVAPPTLLTLVVNKTTGAAAIRNTSASPIAFDYYEVTSAMSALNPAAGAWNSLADQNFDAGLPADFDNNGSVNAADLGVWRASQTAGNAGGDADGDGDTDGADFLAWQQQLGQTAGPADRWGEAGGVSDALLAELQISKASTIAPGQTVNLGTPFRTSVFGPGNDGDLVFQYAAPGSDTFTAGIVQYVTSGPVSAVPEPAAAALATAACLAFASLRRRGR